MSEVVSAPDTRRTKRPGDTTARIGRADLGAQLVRVLARPEPPSVAAGTPLADVLRALHETRGEAVIVCDENSSRLRGIVSEGDVVRRVLARDVDLQRPVSEFMTAEPETLGGDATLLEAMRMMVRGGYRYLPLVDEQGNLIGLLRQQDLLEYVAEAFPQEILNLPPRPHQLMEEPEGG